MPEYADAITRIAYAYGLALAPHAIKIFLLASAGYTWDNRLGRANMTSQALEKKLSASAIQRAKRADSAHQNGLESLPLFAAAVLATVVAGVNGAEVDTWTKGYLGARLAYNLFFIFGENQFLALLRTTSWGASVAASITLLLKASKALALKGV